MSFESNRLKGRVATLWIVSLPIIMIIVNFSLSFLLHLSSSETFRVSMIFSIFGYVGVALFLLAMNGLAKYYNDSRIFKNVLYVLILSIFMGIIYLLVLYTFVIPIVDQLSAYTTTPGNVPPLSILYSFLQVFVPIWLGVSVVAILNGFLFRRAFHALAEKSGEHNFRQAGFFLFIGGLLVIVFVGALLFVVGWIFAILGFFSMKPKASEP